MLEQKRWVRVEHRVGALPAIAEDKEKGIAAREAFDGHLITFKVKRLKFREASELRSVTAKAWAAFEGITEHSTNSQRALASAAFYEALPDAMVEKAFKEYTKAWDGFRDGDEGKAVTEGADMLEWADDDLVVAVFAALRVHSDLSATEGKASASPSTSDTGREASGSSKAASPASAESGTSPATAQETQPASASSSSPGA